MTAPVCNIQPNITINQPDPRSLPIIPIAHDLQSAIAAINALRNLVLWLANRNPAPNNTQAPNRSSSGGSKGSQKQQVGRYIEVSRTTKVQRVYNPKDKEQYVDVKQVTAITMQDTKTGETWDWAL